MLDGGLLIFNGRVARAVAVALRFLAKSYRACKWRYFTSPAKAVYPTKAFPKSSFLR